MQQNKTLVVIPARYGSTRFPGKPLALLAGREIILRVCDSVGETGFDFAVATDDKKILEKVRQAGYEAVMTRSDHPSGTDRVAEAVRILKGEGKEYENVINVQGDEPFISPADVRSLADALCDGRTKIVTMIRPFPKDGDIKVLKNPNLVKVEVSSSGEALTFSRNILPYIRGEEEREWIRHFQFYTHLGIYGFKTEVLGHLTALPMCPLEKAESLEQLRWLDAGYRIKTVVTNNPTIGIDTPDNLREAEEFYEKMLH